MPARHSEPIRLDRWMAKPIRRGVGGVTTGWRPIIRTGLPPAVPYVYRAPRPGWAVRAIAHAEAQHGTPDGE